MSRPKPRAENELRYQRLLLAFTPCAALLLALPAGGWWFALAAPLTLWPTFVAAIRDDRDLRAWVAAVVWAGLLSVGVMFFVVYAPELAARNILRGEAYRHEMWGWIETGVGREGSWRLFLPEHALHLAIFAGLALVSGGYLGLALGAALLAYMNYFVVAVMTASGDWAAGLAAAWFPWSIARVLAFIAIGVLLARPLLKRSAWPFVPRHRQWVAWAAAGILLDILLKFALAAVYRERLERLVDSFGLGS